MNKHAYSLLAATVVAVTLTGCSASDVGDRSGAASPAPSSTFVDSSHNDADAEFATQMIVHHEQAVDMAAVLLEKDGIDERVVALAESIRAAQEPEIATMTAWIDAWRSDDDMDGMDTGMEGMDHGATMSDADMTALASASGQAASRLFLEQMTVHHRSAIDMAKLELGNGENADARALAQKIIDDQTAEISLMTQILAEL